VKWPTPDTVESSIRSEVEKRATREASAGSEGDRSELHPLLVDYNIFEPKSASSLPPFSGVKTW